MHIIQLHENLGTGQSQMASQANQSIDQNYFTTSQTYEGQPQSMPEQNIPVIQEEQMEQIPVETQPTNRSVYPATEFGTTDPSFIQDIKQSLAATESHLGRERPIGSTNRPLGTQHIQTPQMENLDPAYQG